VSHEAVHPPPNPVRPPTRTAAALVIGNEILSGKVRDENLRELAITLRRLGILLRRVVTVLDEIETIAEEVRLLATSHDYLFTSGGVGPTHDDVTFEAVAKAFGVALEPHPDMVAIIRKHYGDRTSEGHLRMALMPAGAVLKTNPAVPWPTTVMQNVWVLPGLPELFKLKMQTVSQTLGSDHPFLSRAVYTNMDEGTLKPLLDAVVAAFPQVEIGSYPTWSDTTYRTKLTFDGKDAAVLECAVQVFVGTLPPGEPQRIE
jgi:molybdopterin-biosynthesis enzyme MoeA-like protein